MKSYIFQSLFEKGFVTDTLISELISVLLCSVIFFKLVLPFSNHYNRCLRYWREIGGPPTHWFYGHLDKYQFNAEGLKNALGRVKKYPKLVCHWIGPFLLNIHLYHPDVLPPVLNKSFPKSYGYRVGLGRLLRNGLITSSGAIWHRHRKMLTSVFHFDIIKSHIVIFNGTVHRMVDYLQKSADSKGMCDVTVPVNNLTYENTMRCVLSQSDLQWGDMTFSDCLKELNGLMMKRVNQPVLFIDFIYNLTPNAKRFDVLQGKVYSMLREIISKRREQVMSRESAKKESKSGKKKFKDFIELLLETSDEKGVLTEDEIMDEVVTFFAAGQETVANSLSWTIYNLAINKDWQDKCREEIMDIIGDNETVSGNDGQRMTTLTMCIKEAMRLYPIVHVVARKLTEDVRLKEVDMTLEKGTVVNVNIFTLHRHPDLWENPDVYDPTRFTPDNSSKRSPYTFIPFAAGPRNCIGQNFAMHQMRVTLSHILRKFEFYVDDSCPKPEMNPNTTLMFKDGMMLKVRSVST